MADWKEALAQWRENHDSDHAEPKADPDAVPQQETMALGLFQRPTMGAHLGQTHQTPIQTPTDPNPP